MEIIKQILENDLANLSHLIGINKNASISLTTQIECAQRYLKIVNKIIEKAPVDNFPKN